MGSHAKLLWVQADSRITTKEQMLIIAQEAHTDMIVVGMNGRKGPKE